MDVNLAARIAAAGHGGQVLVSQTTRALVERALPDGVALRGLGSHGLKDFEDPQPLFDLLIEGVARRLPAAAYAERESSPTNLPSSRTSFVGRERDVAELTRLLARHRLITLTGPGGTGKTRLALRVAADLLERFPDGVYAVDLSAVTDPLLVPSSIAATLGLREVSRARPARRGGAVPPGPICCFYWTTWSRSSRRPPPSGS